MDYRGMIYRALPLAAFILMALVAGASALTYYFDAKAKIANSLTITAPAANATIVTSTTVNDTNDINQCNHTSWYDSMFVDGVWIGDCNFNSCVFNPAPFTVGPHTLQIFAHTINGTPVATPGVLCDSTNYITIYAHATATASSTPTNAPTPTPAPTATAVPYANVVNIGVGGTLPSASACVATANAQTYSSQVPLNDNDGSPAAWNANNQNWTTPSYFYTHAGETINYPNADFAAVDGNYRPGGVGKTQNIILWGACKWGMDKDWAFAQAEGERHWGNNCAAFHGGSGCNSSGDACAPDGNQVTTTVNLSFLGFPVTNSVGNFIGTDFINGLCPGGGGGSAPFASWGLMQSKVKYAEWYTWPMINISTAWGMDYRGAKWRSCMNGNISNAYLSGPIRTAYQADLSLATNSPNAAYSGSETKTFSPSETNLQHFAAGCIGTHFSGSWYANGAVAYQQTIFGILTNQTWPGGTP
jgi:hypothetical protein